MFASPQQLAISCLEEAVLISTGKAVFKKPPGDAVIEKIPVPLGVAADAVAEKLAELIGDAGVYAASTGLPYVMFGLRQRQDSTGEGCSITILLSRAIAATIPISVPADMSADDIRLLTSKIADIFAKRGFSVHTSLSGTAPYWGIISWMAADGTMGCLEDADEEELRQALEAVKNGVPAEDVCA